MAYEQEEVHITQILGVDDAPSTEESSVSATAATDERVAINRDIVEGPIVASIWKLAWPTMLQNAIAGLEGVVDHAMVGHFVGYQGNAAIGVSWQIFVVVVVFVGSLYTGMGVLVARFAGAGEAGKVNRTIYQSFLISSALAVGVLAPVGYLLAPYLLELVHAEPAVQAEALPYLRILFVYSIGILHFFMLGGALRAAGDSRTPLRLGILLTVLNIAFNVVLIRGLGPIPACGTVGAAMGSVIANILVAGIGFYLLFGRRLVVSFSGLRRWGPDWPIVLSLFKFGLPTGFQGIVMNIGGVVLLRYVGSLEQSAEAQAAYTVGYGQLFSFVTWTSLGLLAAVSTVVGQSLGAGQTERAARVPFASAALGLSVAAPIGLLFLLIPGPLLGLFDMQVDEVFVLARQLLSFLSLSGLFLTVALSYTGALQGTGDTRSPFFISVISQLVLPLGLCALLDSVRELVPSDIWLAIVLGHFARGVLSVLRFRQGRWRQIEVDIRAH